MSLVHSKSRLWAWLHCLWSRCMALLEVHVQELVAEVRTQLRLMHIKVPARVQYGGLELMSNYCDGVITIPSWQVVRVLLSRKRFRHTILHEFGHAFHDQHQRQFRERGFYRAFGDPDREEYPDDLRLWWQRYQECDPDFVSAYAMAHPEEDIAETFAYVVEHDLAPPQGETRALQRKLTLMTKLLKDLFWREGQQTPASIIARGRQRQRRRTWGRSKMPVKMPVKAPLV